ncbi:3-hydroxyacyl-CoA dehydrogenase family protein [Streptomyces sioyaensis]|uniref:3-hydroxyacyl-CoA dehydrogenase family protein n=1 Tax=Streptomyces sioyaensis TaxID=67364 RepID=UPI0033EFE0DA
MPAHHGVGDYLFSRLATRLAIASGRPQSTLGIRLLIPPCAGAAVEIVRTSMTEGRSAEVLTSALAKAGLAHADMGATASRDATRLVHAYLNRAVDLYAQGEITGEAIDTAHVTLRALHDETGEAAYEPSPVLTRLLAEGRLGRKTGRGFHAYDAFGKQVVDSPDRAGYIVNYLLFPYLADAIRLLDRPDADITATDEAIRFGYGHPMGPFALLDTIGLDVSLAILRQLHKEFSLPDLTPPEPLMELTALQGAFGRKTGRGFHLW